MTRATTTPRTGRPLKLHTVVDRDDQGRPITAGEKVITLVRSVWCPWEDAAASTGVSARTIRDWRRLGASARERIANWEPGDEPVSRNDRDLAAFVTGLEQAESDVHARHLNVVTRAGEEGFTEIRVVETEIDGKVKSRVTTTINKPPVWAASAWMLERHRQDIYAIRHELTGAKGAPLAASTSDRAEKIGGWLEGYLTGKADQEAVAATPTPPLQ